MTHTNGSDHFSIWWQAYPRKVGKKVAAAEHARIIAKGEATAEQLLTSLHAYVSSKPAKQDWCHPITWLHQGRWSDEPPKSVTDAAAEWFLKQQEGNEDEPGRSN
jgi:hypothetical protein